ncbi:MAG: response regulator [Candidatus Lokiarchaeota archaeon]|nr:response regulator [Candidatus Lokiarchaeota archaeon]
MTIIKIFIVEDDFSLQRLYELMLTNYGFEVIGKANNGEEALKMYKEFNDKPEIILMDHRMPIKNGIETTREIIKLNYDTIIIFASADKTVKDEALSIGASRFLSKPFSYEELIDEIKDCLNLK